MVSTSIHEGPYQAQKRGIRWFFVLPGGVNRCSPCPAHLVQTHNDDRHKDRHHRNDYVYHHHHADPYI